MTTDTTNLAVLIARARAMAATGKGLLAIDESNGTCNRRFASIGISQTEDMRRDWRALLLSTPGLSRCIGGVILYDETIRQTAADGRPLTQLAHDAGLLIGIKVDTGAKPLAAHPGETVTEGLDGLRERLQSYSGMGAGFAKWRAVFAVDDRHLPTRACIAANAQALARYAVLCQEAGLVPIVEPEILMDGPHTQARCQDVTETVLHSVFEQLVLHGATLEALILKPNMVIAGQASTARNTAAEVAEATLQCLRRSVPAAVPGIMFLSGGQSAEQASAALNAINLSGEQPWPLSFSFGRALQYPALQIWAGQAANRVAAQDAVMHRARCNSAALTGAYGAAMETA